MPTGSRAATRLRRCRGCSHERGWHQAVRRVQAAAGGAQPANPGVGTSATWGTIPVASWRVCATIRECIRGSNQQWNVVTRNAASGGSRARTPIRRENGPSRPTREAHGIGDSRSAPVSAEPSHGYGQRLNARWSASAKHAPRPSYGPRLNNPKSQLRGREMCLKFAG